MGLGIGASLLPANGADAQELLVASALSSRFETVVYSKPNLVFRSTDSPLPDEAKGALIRPFYVLVAGLDGLSKEVSKEIDLRAVAVLVGTKHYLPPTGLGRVHSQNCYVVILEESGSKLDLRKHFAESSTTILGHVPVWNWSAKIVEFGELDDRPSSFFAAQIGSSYLLVSNNLEELRSIASKLQSREASSESSVRIPTWETISQQEMWGYRRYRHEGIVNRLAAGMTNVTPGARELIFYLDAKRNNFTLQLICSRQDESTPALINSTAIFGRLGLAGDGVWQKTLPLAGDLETLERLMVVMEMLGFGIWV